MFTSPGNVFLNVNNYELGWYVTLSAIGFVSSYFFILYVGKINNIQRVHITNLTSFEIIFGVIFARLYYVLLNWGYYKINLSEIFMLWKGGLAIHGGILGAIFIISVYCYLNKLNILKYLDVFSCGAILFQSIARWGNFFNSEAFGLPTTLPWKLYIPSAYRPLKFQNYEFFHPAFLYESLWNIFVLYLLLLIIKRYGRNYAGITFCFYLILYSIGRFLIESIRIDCKHYIFGLHFPQFISIIFITTGIFCVALLYKNKSKCLN